jgi:hypothetical protein
MKYTNIEVDFLIDAIKFLYYLSERKYSFKYYTVYSWSQQLNNIISVTAPV